MDINELNTLFPEIKLREKELVVMGDNAKVAVYRLSKEVRNDKENSIIFIPGFTSYFSQWSEIINSFLENNFQVFVFETREKKSSTSKVSDPRFNTLGLIADLTDVVNYLQLPQPFYLVGNSLGTAIIMKYLIDYNNNKKMLPEKIALIQAVYTSKSLKKIINIAKQPMQFRFLMRLFIIFAPIILLRRRIEQPNYYRNTLRNFRTTNIEKMRIGLLCSEEMKIKNELSKITVPTLAIGITNDKIHPIEQAIYISEAVKVGQYQEIKDIETINSINTAELIISFFKEC